MKTRTIAVSLLLAAGAAVTVDSNAEAVATAHLMVETSKEIQAAENAASVGVDAIVAEYAVSLTNEHSQIPASSATLPVTPMADNEAAAQKKTASLQCPAVPAASGTEIEAGYIDALFECHQEALRMIDNRSVATDTSAPDNWHLTQTREDIAMRSKKAKALRGD